MFSPYYARARSRGAADPLEHCALNLALYGPRGKRWTLTERGRHCVHREPDRLVLGPSRLHWTGDCLTIDVDEIAVPLPARVRGRIRLHPQALTPFRAALDDEGRHHWRPIAPCARVEVDLDRPSLRWCGDGYLDSNAGDAPLEQAFRGWNWSRARVDGGTAVLYDVCRRDGGTLGLAMTFDAAGSAQPFPAPPRVDLPGTHWGIARATRADASCMPAVLRTLEDTPFYARSLLDTRLLGAATTSVHESLSLERFRAAWVRLLLPFRMPRAPRLPSLPARDNR